MTLNNKLKVLLVSPYGKDTGGIARWTEHILSYYHLHNDKVEIDLLPTGRNEVGKLRKNIFLRILYGIKVYWEILKEEEKKLGIKSYHVFHLTSSASLGLLKDYFMLRLARKKGVKTIIHFRFGRIPELSNSKNWEWKMIKKVIQLSDRVIVLDELSYQSLKSEGYSHIFKLPNPLSPRVLELIKQYGKIERNDRSILFVGHGYWDKGVKELVLACREIPNIKVIMIGSIEEDVSAELKKMTKNANWLEIKGDTSYDEVIREMLECGIFVLPTYTEGFPNVILEAMACGSPIVTTGVGAIPEMMNLSQGDVNGICVKPKDVEELKGAIMQLLDNREFAIMCGVNARKRVNELYSMPKIWNELLTIWNIM